MSHRERLVIGQTEYGWFCVYRDYRIQVGEAFLDRRLAEKLKRELEEARER